MQKIDRVETCSAQAWPPAEEGRARRSERGQSDWRGDQGGGPSEGMTRAGLREVVRSDRPFSLQLVGVGGNLRRPQLQPFIWQACLRQLTKGAGSEPRGETKAPSAAG